MAHGTFAISPPNTLTPQELAEGWVLLFDGESFFGLERKGVAPQWEIDHGILSCESGEDSWIISSTAFSDFVFKVEYRNPPDGNSGVFVRASGKGEPAQTGYEVQICDMHRNYPTGSLVNIKKARRTLLDPEMWHNMEITAESDHLIVRLDGSRLLDTHDPAFRQGHIGMQYNQGKRIEFRNLKLKPLGMKPLFNGATLGGWNIVNRPDSPNPAVWSVIGGMIHVEKGPGILETETEYQDFLIQLEARTHPASPDQHSNGGVFLRGDKGKIGSGYEVQIRNEFQQNDPAQAVDFGTGGIYDRQAARRVFPRDGEFFYETIAAEGRHLAVWVNGIQVSDFIDLNPEGADVSKNQARLKPGTISLQAHDPTTNLDFRNLRIVPFPPSRPSQP
jgi:hypothetical protein